MIVSCMSVATMLEKPSDDGPEQKLATARKVSLFISTHFGLSLQDLPGPIKAKVDSFGKSPEETKPAKASKSKESLGFVMR